ncbi:hypothetical protein NT239_04105 [Chitinibacter sp. SCUT-21]|uniref:hypothetical protein n=1 Tax=Chitinibacter sp. SCUT-21 TaxID=2970891 RepID=UPI0035A61885
MNSATELSDPIIDKQGTTLLELARMVSEKGPQDGIGLSDLKASAANELRRFGDDLSSHLAAHTAIQVPPAYQLRSTSNGQVCVVGEHPDKAKIENYLNSDTRLLKWFKEIEVLFEIQRRLELNATGGTMDDQVFNLGMTSLGSIAFFTTEK